MLVFILHSLQCLERIGTKSVVAQEKSKDLSLVICETKLSDPQTRAGRERLLLETEDEILRKNEANDLSCSGAMSCLPRIRCKSCAIYFE